MKMKHALLLAVVLTVTLSSAQSLTSVLTQTSPASISSKADGTPAYLQVPIAAGSLLIHTDFNCATALCFTSGPLLTQAGNRMSFGAGGTFTLQGVTNDRQVFTYSGAFLQANLAYLADSRHIFTAVVVGDLTLNGVVYPQLHAVVSDVSEAFTGKILNGLAMAGGGISIAF